MWKLPLFLAGDVATVLEKRRRDCVGEEMRTGRKKKHGEQMVFLFFNFFVNSKKMGKTIFCCSLNSAILRTRGTTKTKMTLSTKQVFGVFCFQE